MGAVAHGCLVAVLGLANAACARGKTDATPPESPGPSDATNASAESEAGALARTRTADAPRIALHRDPSSCDEYGDCTGLRGCDFAVTFEGFPVVSDDAKTWVFALRTESVTTEADYGTLRIEWLTAARDAPQTELVYPTLDECEALYAQTERNVRRVNAKLRGPWIRPRRLDVDQMDGETPEEGQAIMWLDEDALVIERNGAELFRFSDPRLSQYTWAESIWATPGRRTIAVQLREITAGHDEDILGVIVLPTPAGLLDVVDASPATR